MVNWFVFPIFTRINGVLKFRLATISTLPVKIYMQLSYKSVDTTALAPTINFTRINVKDTMFLCMPAV